MIWGMTVVLVNREGVGAALNCARARDSRPLPVLAILLLVYISGGMKRAVNRFAKTSPREMKEKT